MDEKMWPFAPLFVIGNSIFGMAVAMTLSPYFLIDIWAQSVIADLIFVAGSVGIFVGIEAIRNADIQAKPVLAVVVALVANWAVYSLSFSFVNYVGDEGANGGEVIGFTLSWGWIGLLAVATYAGLRVTKFGETRIIYVEEA